MSERYIVLTISDCRWCDKAKALLVLNDKEFAAFRVDEKPFSTIAGAFNFKTYPQVFVSRLDRQDVTHIGGFENLKRHIERAS